MAKIILAKNSGFCPGVKNAIDLVIELSKKSQQKIYTLGPLIHNKEVIKTLENQNIFAVENPKEIKEEGAILVIRAHGITPELEQKIRQMKLQIVDGTCPLVKNVHKLIEKYSTQGYTTIIFGDKDHAEVIGLKGYAGINSYIINSMEEAQKIPKLNKAHLVSQTTQEEEVFYTVAEEIKKRVKELIISNTICSPTKLRQKETYEFSKDADMVIVVGGRNSANTKRLFSICSKLAKKVTLVENADELKKEEIKGMKKIFITAGASTPQWLIEEVFQKINKFSKQEEKILAEKLELLWKSFINSGIYTGISAAFLTLASARMAGIAIIPKKILLISATFVLSLHVLNRASHKTQTNTDEIKKILFVKFGSITKCLAYLSGIISILLAFQINLKIFFLISILWTLGIIYPPLISKHFQRIDASKDIILAGGWTFACSGMPILWLEENFSSKIFLVIVFVFILSIIRSILLSISQEHNDMIVGKENIYKVIGPEKTELLLYVLSLAAIIILCYFIFRTTYSYLILSSLLFYPSLIYLFNKNKIPDKTNSEVLIDLQFIILGIVLT